MAEEIKQAATMAAQEAETQTDTQAEGGKQEQPAAAGSSTAAKTYDQAYVDKLLADSKAAQEAAVAEAMKVAAMKDDEKAAYEKTQTEKRLADREAQIARRELKADARQVLSDKEVPAEFLDMLLGKDLQETEKNVTAFKAAFDSAVQAQVEKRLVGKTPVGGSGSTTTSAAQAMQEEIAKYL